MLRVLALTGMLIGCADVFDLERVDDFPDSECPYGRHGLNGTGSQAGLLDVCLTRRPQAAFGTNVLTIDTDDDTQCSAIVIQADNGMTDVCVIAATTMDFASVTQARGNRPLVLVATETLEVRGTISVASRNGGPNGAGAYSVGCPDADGTSSNSSAGGGGAGGSLQTLGGNGGLGANATPGGMARPVEPTVTIVRGGCRGSTGGGAQSILGGQEGSAGGGLYLIAGVAITIRTGAVLDASGEGGEGGEKGPQSTTPDGSGGGGGGSGGLIGLDAPRVVIEPGAILVANGGGGGGGGGRYDGVAGTNGLEADPAGSFPFQAAGGGGGSSGGSGSSELKTGTKGSDGMSNVGGGGGGGGAGFIRVFAGEADRAAAIASPPIN